MLAKVDRDVVVVLCFLARDENFEVISEYVCVNELSEK